MFHQAEASKAPILLLVEDNRADVFLVRRAIEFHHVPVRVVVAQDGEEALQYLERAAAGPDGARPGVVLMDINLPKRSGIEILEKVRESPRYQAVPVIMVTTSGDDDDREESARLGATRYFQKPSSYQEYLQIGEMVKEVLREASTVARPGAA